MSHCTFLCQTHLLDFAVERVWEGRGGLRYRGGVQRASWSVVKGSIDHIIFKPKGQGRVPVKTSSIKSLFSHSVKGRGKGTNTYLNKIEGKNKLLFKM